MTGTGGEIPSNKVTACHRLGSLQTDSEMGGCVQVSWRVLLGHSCKEERKADWPVGEANLQDYCTWAAADLIGISGVESYPELRQEGWAPVSAFQPVIVLGHFPGRGCNLG